MSLDTPLYISRLLEVQHQIGLSLFDSTNALRGVDLGITYF